MNGFRITLAVMAAVAGSVHAQSLERVERTAHQIEGQADILADEVRHHLSGSPFERRLLNDAAELHRVAHRIEDRAAEHGNLYAMLGETRHLANILRRMDRALSDAEAYDSRLPWHSESIHHEFHHVRQAIARTGDNVSRLEHYLEAMTRVGPSHHDHHHHHHGYSVPSGPRFTIDTGRFVFGIGR